MRVAIRVAMKNTDPTAQAFWKQIAPDWTNVNKVDKKKVKN